MGSIIKTISLDGRTAKIAETIPNFSQWIRAKLLELEEKRITPRVGYEYTCPECYHFWVFNKPKNWFYCIHDGCQYKADISTTCKVVDLE